MANAYGISDSVWKNLTKEEKSYYSSGNASSSDVKSASGSSSSSGSSNSSSKRSSGSSYIVSDDSDYDTTGYIDELKEAQIAANISALKKSRDTALSSLSTEKATIEPTYQKQKIAADVTAKQTARSFEEYMAQRGGGAAKSGISGQGQLMNNIAYQGQKGTLDAAEASALTNNAQRVTDVNNAYSSDVAAAKASAEATALQNYITQMNADREFALNEKSTNASVASTNASTEYQRLVNANYPAQQAAQMAQAAASLTGTNLANDYQKLVNAGYPAQQAAELAQAAASTAAQYANISQGNAQIAISQQNANTSATNSQNDTLNSIVSNLNKLYVADDGYGTQTINKGGLVSAINGYVSAGTITQTQANQLFSLYSL